MVFLVVWSLDSQEWDWHLHYKACDTYAFRHEDDIPKDSIIFATLTHEEAEEIAQENANERDWPTQVIEVEEPKKKGRCSFNRFGITYPSKFLKMDDDVSSEDEESKLSEESDEDD